MINAANPAVIDYRGTFDSNETGKANLLRAGVKIAVDFGWGNRRAELEEQARLADELAAAQQKARQDSIAQAEARAKAIADSLAHARAEQALRDSLAAANANAHIIFTLFRMLSPGSFLNHSPNQVCRRQTYVRFRFSSIPASPLPTAALINPHSRKRGGKHNSSNTVTANGFFN